MQNYICLYKGAVFPQFSSASELYFAFVIKTDGEQPFAIPWSVTHDWSVSVHVKAEMVLL